MDTRVSSGARDVIIGHNRPTVLIGERINPTGRKTLYAALVAGDMTVVQRMALSQVQAGADILDVNVGLPGVDEAALLPRAVQAVMEVVDVPLCLDSHNLNALQAALQVYKGKALVNSVNGQAASLTQILPLVKEYGAAVIGLAMNDQGIPEEAEGRVAIARLIVEHAEALGIPRQDVIIDCLALAVGVDSNAGMVTLEAVRRVRDELCVNQTLGISNISFGLPQREMLTSTFAVLAIAAGVTCLLVDVAKVRPAVVSADLALGRDSYAQRYIKAYRRAHASASG